MEFFRQNLIIRIVILISIFALSVKGENKSIICHVGGTMRPVIKELARQYTKKTGVPVEINSAGSGELLAHIEMQKRGDLYICHDPFLDILMKKGLGVDGWTVAELTPVIVVRKGNPKKIKGLKDLTRSDVQLILTDYRLSSLGRMLPTIFKKGGIDFLKLNREKNVVINKSGSYSANYVKMGNADASIVWKAVQALRKDSLDAIEITEQLPIPGIDAVTSATGKAYYLTPMRVTVATLRCSKNKKKATKFAAFLTGKHAAKTMKIFGFTMDKPELIRKEYHDGKAIKERVEKNAVLRLYAGAGLRKAVEALIVEFQKETGIKVEPDYGGSGIIITRAREDRVADLFMPGDVWYVDRLQEKSGLIAEKSQVAYFVPVIITAKGNPYKVKGLKDFIRKDLRIALGRAKACQIGRLSRKIFKKNAIDINKEKNILESLTVNELGVWVKMANADAAIVWDAIAANIAKDVDIIKIPKSENIISSVVIGRMTSAAYPIAAKKFVEFITGPKGRAILKSKGYRTEIK